MPCFVRAFPYPKRNHDYLHMKHLSFPALTAVALMAVLFSCKKVDEVTDFIKGGHTKDKGIVYKETDSVTKGGRLSAAVVGDKVIFVGQAIDVFDTKNGHWSTVPYFSYYPGVIATVGNKVVITGSTTTAYVYDGSSGQLSSGITLSEVDRTYDVGAAAGTKVVFAGGSASMLGGTAGSSPIGADIYDVNTGVVINSQLSKGRTFVSGAGAGNKILIAGGQSSDSLYVKTVDIYDVSTGQWAVSYLSAPRIKMTAAAAGNKILFAGGLGNTDHGFDVSDVVDIYDVSTGQWSVAHLSEARAVPTPVVVGNLVFFAGGVTRGGNNGGLVGVSAAVDIYNAATGQWTTASLSEPRGYVAAAATGTKVVFAGGYYTYGSNDQGLSLYWGTKTIDVYDMVSQQWSTDSLTIARGMAAAGATNKKLVVAGGAKGSSSIAPGFYDELVTPVRAADIYTVK
jgi:hypothetical protein